jgi:HEPN domain-containing protein
MPERWLAFASEDLRMAELALREGSGLLAGAPDSWFSSMRVTLIETMDSYYLPSRYPDALPGTLPERVPEKEDAVEAVELARQAWEEARRLVGDDRVPSPGA